MFHRCKTAQEAQTLWLRLAMTLHPSKETGAFDLFAILMESYEKFLEEIKSEKPQDNLEFLLPGKYQFTDKEVTFQDSDQHEILNEIDLFANKNSKFNRKFFDSVCDQFHRYENMTMKQYNALVKIYYQFRMHEPEKKEEQDA
jgi:hypothetical protein